MLRIHFLVSALLVCPFTAGQVAASSVEYAPIPFSVERTSSSFLGDNMETVSRIQTSSVVDSTAVIDGGATESIDIANESTTDPDDIYTGNVTTVGGIDLATGKSDFRAEAGVTVSSETTDGTPRLTTSLGILTTQASDFLSVTQSGSVTFRMEMDLVYQEFLGLDADGDFDARLGLFFKDVTDVATPIAPNPFYLPDEFLEVNGTFVTKQTLLIRSDDETTLQETSTSTTQEVDKRHPDTRPQYVPHFQGVLRGFRSGQDLRNHGIHAVSRPRL